MVEEREALKVEQAPTTPTAGAQPSNQEEELVVATKHVLRYLRGTV